MKITIPVSNGLDTQPWIYIDNYFSPVALSRAVRHNYQLFVAKIIYLFLRDVQEVSERWLRRVKYTPPSLMT